MEPLSPWSFPGKSTGVGSLSLLQGIFPTQGPNPGLPHCRQILNQLSHKESPTVRKCCNKLNWHWISLALTADVRGGKQRIVPKVKENRNYLFLTWLTVLSVMWCHIIVSKSGDGSQFLQRLDLEKKEKEYGTFYKLKRSRFASTNAHKGKAFK